MGSYLNKSKVGYSFLVLSPAAEFPAAYAKGLSLPDPPADIPPFLLYSEAEIEVMAYGKRKPVVWKIIARLNSDFSLSSFGFELGSDGSAMEMTGRLSGHELSLDVHSSGDVRTEPIQVADKPVFLAEALPNHLASRIARGFSIDGEYQVFEPQQISVSAWKISLEIQEHLDLGGPPVEAWRIKQESGGFCPITWIDLEGKVLKEWAPLGDHVGYLSFAESEEQARNKGFIHPAVLADASVDSDGKEPDLMYSTAIETGRDISAPSSVKRMVVDLWDFSLDHPFPSSECQRVLTANPGSEYSQQSPLRLELTVAARPETAHHASAKSQPPQAHSKYLQPEPLVQSDHPEIQQLARNITKGLSDPWEKALAIHAWMGKHIETEFRITLPSAIEVLHTGKGDCNEQSALFTALARAAGVPTRICTGLVHQRKAFYYHAWNEVLAGTDPERWVPIDPVLREQVADATHIKMGEGGLAEQTYITGLIGKIRARILDLETNDRDQPPHPALRPDNRG
jgi:hypothetical protein